MARQEMLKGGFRRDKKGRRADGVRTLASLAASPRQDAELRMRSEPKILWCQAGLADDGAGGSNGQFLFGWGTMAIRPAAFLYLAWLPRWVTNENP